ncbi:MAG: PEP-CTERM sorting domain-containing protein [Planctomycetota bacterium]
MTNSIKRRGITGLLAALAVATPGFAVEIGRDDFNSAFSPLGGVFFQVGSDASASNFTSRTFTPNNADNTGFGGNPGTFGGSNFDYFGVTTRGINFDVADDSAGSFAGDQFGVLGSSKTDGVVAMSDTANSNNLSGDVSIDWTFDISGYQNISVSLDLAAIGNFEASDVHSLTASIDGGTAQPLMSLAYAEETGPSGAAPCVTCYSVTMEGGVTYTDFFGAFFEDVAWNEWAGQTTPFDLPVAGSIGPAFIASDGTEIIGFNTFDTDMDGLTERQDGTTSRAYREYVTPTSGTPFESDAQELELYLEPLLVNGGTALDNDLTTFTFPVSGTGTTLSLSYNGNNNSDQEVVVFDNLVIEGDLIPSLNADYDSDGDVDVADALAGQRLGEDLNGDFESEFGTGELPVSAVGAVPEPAAVSLVGLGLALLAGRRRNG